MSDNPYQPPESSYRRPGAPRGESTAWKVLFWITAFLMVLTILSVPYFERLSAFDVIDLVISSFMTFGLCGFAYSRSFVTVVFWRYLFYAAMLEYLLYSVGAPFYGLERAGVMAEFGALHLFEVVYGFVLLRAVYLYAYRRPQIWVTVH